MNATEFIKENYTLINGGEDYMCNHSGKVVGSEDIAEAYHKHKLKLLRTPFVLNCNHENYTPLYGREGELIEKRCDVCGKDID